MIEKDKEMKNIFAKNTKISRNLAIIGYMILAEGAGAMKQKNNGKKKTILTRAELVRVHRKDTLFSIAVFTVTTIGCFFFNRMASDPTLNIAMLYTLGVFIIARYTEGYLYGVLFAVTSVLSVNFFFTYPFRNFNFSLKGYQVTFFRHEHQYERAAEAAGRSGKGTHGSAKGKNACKPSPRSFA